MPATRTPCLVNCSTTAIALMEVRRSLHSRLSAVCCMAQKKENPEGEPGSIVDPIVPKSYPCFPEAALKRAEGQFCRLPVVLGHQSCKKRRLTRMTSGRHGVMDFLRHVLRHIAGKMIEGKGLVI